MMTTLVYHQDSYLKTLDSVVSAVDAEKNGIYLSETIIYPSGGGQPADEAVFTIEGKLVPLKKVERGNLYVIEGDLPAVGTSVRTEINWERRYQLMRTHTAMHILCGVVWRDYGASVTGGNMEPLSGRMDFEFARLEKELVGEIEAKINAEVEAQRDIRVQVLPREEAFQIPDLIRTKINLLPEGIPEVRTVEIVGLDLQADGGTHVANTREVGRIRITDYKSKGGINKRIYVELDE